MSIPISILMFPMLAVLLALNIPVAFALLMTAVTFSLILWGWFGLDIIFNAFWNVMNNFALTSLVPFVFMAALLQECGIVEDMYKTLNIWIGRYKGSLLIISLLLGYAIGAMSGVVAAGVVTLGLLIYPMMRKYGYPQFISLSTIIFAGSLPQIVPPSLNMIIYGVTTGVSIGKLFAGGIAVGALMTLIYMVYTVIWTYFNRDKIQVIPAEKIPLKEKILVLRYFIGPILIILSALGTIFAGIATPTEAAGMAAFVTLLYTIALKRLNRERLKKALAFTVKVVVMVEWIVASAYAFTAIFTGGGGRTYLTNVMLSLPNAHLAVLILSLGLVAFLGCFLDTAAIITIIAPLMDPVIRLLGYNATWYGIIFNTVLLTGFLTPPVGLALYYIKGMYPDLPWEDVMKSSVPGVIAVLLSALLSVIFPEIPMSVVRLLTGSA
ncbi:MAG: TRAP transporter large permease subunit [Sulfolobales archaeon]|nr:TRAP transporter large permease subunit [Sulfolobales archaeon]MCX8186062.1 TRAP transporter large permease subunit [Sulfolobales archaeon]MDW7969357.1 TRAP transporter large permease subunit [Sulfolobales archaeon]